MNKGPVSCSRTLYCFCTEPRGSSLHLSCAAFVSFVLLLTYYINCSPQTRYAPTQNLLPSFAIRTKVKIIHFNICSSLLLATFFRYFTPFFLILGISRPFLFLLVFYFYPFFFPFYQMQPVFRALMEMIPTFPVIFIKNTKNQPVFVHRTHMPTEHIDGIKKELHTL